MFYEGEADSAFALEAVSPALRADGLDDSPAAKVMADQHAAWQAWFPAVAGATWPAG